MNCRVSCWKDGKIFSGYRSYDVWMRKHPDIWRTSFLGTSWPIISRLRESISKLFVRQPGRATIWRTEYLFNLFLASLSFIVLGFSSGKKIVLILWEFNKIKKHLKRKYSRTLLQRGRRSTTFPCYNRVITSKLHITSNLIVITKFKVSNRKR